MDSKTLNHRRTRRTTLTLEADVADYLERKLASDKKLKEKHLINDLLRKGIRNDETNVSKKFTVRGFKTTLKGGLTSKQLEDLLDEI
jgi:hypothetical protein